MLIKKDMFVFSLYNPDIDECQSVPSVCHSDADCTDIDGSYECTCRIGYSGNGTLCTGNIFMQNCTFDKSLYISIQF